MVPVSGTSPVLAPGFLPPGPGDLTGQVLTGAYQPYGADPFGLSITAGYRFMPAFSVGGWFEYVNFQVQGGGDTGDYTGDYTSQLQRNVLQGGVYGRYYLTTLHRALHPWVELGVGYTYDTSSYTRVPGATPITEDYYLTYQGIVTNVRVGLDWRLAPIFAVGPVLGYSHTFPLSACVDAEAQGDANHLVPPSDSRNTCDSSAVQASSYGVIFGGIFAKVTLGPDVE